MKASNKQIIVQVITYKKQKYDRVEVSRRERILPEHVWEGYGKMSNGVPKYKGIKHYDHPEKQWILLGYIENDIEYRIDGSEPKYSKAPVKAKSEKQQTKVETPEPVLNNEDDRGQEVANPSKKKAGRPKTNKS